MPTDKNKSKYDTALKLHRKFAHPSPDKLIKLINSAGEHWERMRNLKKSLKNVSDDCKICQIYRKSPARPVVGSAMATSFKECVAMGLKFYKGKIILHLVDHTTRLSTSCFVTSKEPEVIINWIFRSWIQIYGTPEKFLSDNGAEFANSSFIDMWKSMNIVFKFTAAEAPFSTGLVERHNMIITDMLDKVLNESNIDINLALSW